jgi:ATP-dependent helicase/nuclease subunit B
LRRIAPPYPKPAVAERPRRLSVTRIETLFRDPYEIYARYVLNLRKLDPLEAEIGALERGNTLHRIMEIFVQSFAGKLPADAASRLIDIADRIFREDRTPQASLAVWRPRFDLAVPRLIANEVKRRDAITKSHVEIEGSLSFHAPGGDFKLTAKADRIDVFTDGNAAILDYKSGRPPSPKQVKEILSPQLLLEGAILKTGGFEGVGALQPVELIYVGFAGREPGEFTPLNVDVTALVIEAEARLKARITLYDSPDIGYASRLMPFRKEFAGDYDHLARAQEWSQSGEDGE